jgi:hypothetical protein
MSFAGELQNGSEASTLEVDPRADVSDDTMSWEAFLHVVDLPLEVLFLTVGGDSAVADGLFFL